MTETKISGNRIARRWTIGLTAFVLALGGAGTAFQVLNSSGGGIFQISSTGTASGVDIAALNSLRSSGSLVWEGAASGSSLYVATSLQGAGLTDCDLTTQKLQWDDQTSRFSCGTVTAGSSFGTGNVVFIGDRRYLRTAGGTLTGAVAIQNGNTHAATTTPLLNVRGTMSGRSLYISGTGSSPLLAMNLGKSFVGIGTATPTANLQVVSSTTGGVLQLKSFSNSATTGVPSVLSLYSAGGTADSPSATKGTDGGTKPSIWQIKFQGRDNVGDTLSAAEIRATAGCSGCNGVWGAGGHSTALEFYTTPTNSTTLTKAMTIGQDGAINFNVSGFSFPASGSFSPPSDVIMNGAKALQYTHPLVGTVGFMPSDGSVVATHIGANDFRLDLDPDGNNGGTANGVYFGKGHLMTSLTVGTNVGMVLFMSGSTPLSRMSINKPSPTWATTKATLDVAGTVSGSTFVNSGKPANTLVCYKAGGVQGYWNVTATGTLTGTCN